MNKACVEEWVEHLVASLPEGIGGEWQQETNGRPICDLYIGSPASGKSLHIAQRAKSEDFVLVDSDVIGKMMEGDLTQEERYREGKEIANAFLQAMFKECRSVVIAATGANYEACAAILYQACAQGYQTRVIWIKVSLKTALRRNERRKDRLPDDIVIQKWHRSEEHARKLGRLVLEFQHIDNEVDKN